MYRVVIRAALCAAIAMLPAAALAQEQRNSRRPNVILIITDDVGYGDLGSYGAPDVKTPHIDGLARDGVRLTDFYANGATCTPTRTGLISGRYQQRFGLEHPLGAQPPADGERGLLPTGWSLPQLLKNNGYATALIGKWHLGWKSEFSPIAHGFDYFFGFKSGYVDYYQHTTGTDAPLRADLFENDRAVVVPGYMTDLITERSVRFIEQNAGRPFFLDVAYNAAHWPYQRPDQPSTARDDARHLGPFDDPTSTRADYVSILERADQGVGRILAVLDKAGLRRNTIVIFTNDNGGEWLSRNAPLFHRKGSVWEGGIRVPAIIRWPGRIRAGRVMGQVGITMDLTATILAATGTTVPPEARLEGINLLPVLEGRAREIERTLFWRVTGARTQQAVRSGTWKLVLDEGRALLFNLRGDVGERHDLIGRRPDVARRLRSLLAAWQEDVDAEAKRAPSR
ncbi:MAG TPA: sulfatase-like hydrolase/transferase [Pyrinomonadaceae bacterium]|nr:sulfatase-like hydrolase/transferase [Pyrinomonadaceae bacterium]